MKLLLTALAAARLLACADFALPDLLPPDANFVFGIRVRSLLDSELLRSAGATSDPQAKALTGVFLKQAAMTGFDPLHDLDEALIASSADSQDAPTLILLRGHFNLEKMTEGAERYHDIALIGPGKGNTAILAPLDSTTALAGDPALVRAAVDRHAAGAVANGALAARVQEMRDHFDIWATGERPQGFVAPAGTTQQMDSIDRLQFGIRVTSGLDLSAELHARSAADVKTLSGTFDMLQMMIQAQGANAPKFHIEQHDATWKITLSVTEKEIQQALAAQRASMAAGAAKAVPTKPTARPMTIVGGESSSPATTTGSGTNVFTLPGKHK